MKLTRDTPLTSEQLTIKRRESLKFLNEEMGNPITEFTCDNCSIKSTCVLVYDGYNTDGDCLAEK